MKKASFIFFLAFVLIGSTANAQFNKPLQSASSRVNTSEARYNIGISGGLNSTYWFHFGGTKTRYKEPFNFGILGGLTVERMLNKNMSISLEGFYAMRNMQLNYEIHNFPVSLGMGPEHNKDYYRQLDVDYTEINVQAPFTYYFSNSTIRPYVFVGPRVSVPMSGKMIWKKAEIVNGQQSSTWTSVDTVGISAQNMWQWNIGVVGGAGVMFKLNVGNYYFLIKADASAHASLAYFLVNINPFDVHASVINSFTHEETSGTSQNVVGAGYIDPYLLGTRINTDATVKVTLLFPLKKQLQGACMRWGEYD
jgi:hypothetical protein